MESAKHIVDTYASITLLVNEFNSVTLNSDLLNFIFSFQVVNQPDIEQIFRDIFKFDMFQISMDLSSLWFSTNISAEGNTFIKNTALEIRHYVSVNVKYYKQITDI